MHAFVSSLTGEIVVAGATKVLRFHFRQGEEHSGASGTLYITNYRIAFTPARVCVEV